MTDTAVAEASAETPSMSTTAAFVRLIVIVGSIAGGFILLGMINLLVVILALIVMILLHELGHFATAKWSGMKVTEFFVGFGPRLWSVKRGETEYGVKAIPGGGYCRIVGMSSLEEIDPSDEPRAYRNQPFAKRIGVASAGSAMHFLIAFVLAFGALTLIGRPDPSIVVVQGYLNLDGVGATPAQLAGLAAGDRILSVNGTKVTSDAALSKVVHKKAGQPVALVVMRNGASRSLTVTPLDGRDVKMGGAPLAARSGPATGYLGISLGQGTSTMGPLAAAGHSATIVRQATTGAVTGIAHLFSPSGLQSYATQVINPAPPQSPVEAPGRSSKVTAQDQSRPESIIGAVRTASQAAQAGALTLIEVLISINIFIGIINMLPMLPLDGGHVAIAGYEWIRTRKGRPMYRADVTKLMPIVYAFVAFLVLLVTTSAYLDLTHPVANPFQ
ncbi:MAG: site-2 protease family protein [Actinomycetes bacterium]